jgi:hypothetical protein
VITALYNSDCTLYLYTPICSNNKRIGTYKRVYISKCYWEESIKERNDTVGLKSNTQVNIILFNDSNIPKHPTKDIVVQGNCTFSFSDSLQEENISQSIKRLKADYQCRVVQSVKKFMYGGLPHIEIVASV